MRSILIGLGILAFLPLVATTIPVTSTADTNTTGTLRYAILNSSAGDTIDCTAIAGGTINLTSSLPAITHNLTFTNTAGGSVTINGGGFQAFSVGAGTISMEKFTISGAISLGGVGGDGYCGGGGGVGGGGGLYIQSGSNVTIDAFAFSMNQAIGGAGGAGNASDLNCGGGGGGFGGGAGGANGGGGGGGNTGGGAGGNSSTPNGTAGTGFGGGGGGGVNGAGGSANSAANAGGTSSSGNGGGGAGANATNSLGKGGNASSTAGGAGGAGLGSNNAFGGGGGGAATSGNAGGAGAGTGGGGSGSNNSAGGAGGTVGGGGGGGGSSAGGGAGGFGAGGGGSGSGAGGTSLFGGGAGGSGAGAGGGGGAGLGGAIFIDNGAILTIEDASSLFSNPTTNAVVAGAGGVGSTSGAAGTALGSDIFLSSGGSLIFNNSVGITISSAINSDQGAGGGSSGGLTMRGSGTLILSGTNTYTGTTTITAGTLEVPSDSALGASSTKLVLGGGTLQASGSFTSARGISLLTNSTINTSSNTVTLSGAITGSGVLTKSGSGTLILSGTNTYSGGTTINNGILQGTTSSLQGSMNIGGSGTLAFNQTTSGTYSGALSGTGTVSLLGTGTIQLTGSNTGFTGTISISQGNLNVSTTSLSNATINIAHGGTLSGVGTVGPVVSDGTISAGNSSVGTLAINGNMTLMSDATIAVSVTPTSAGLITVSGNGSLGNANVRATLSSGFYGFQSTYKILQMTTQTGFLSAPTSNNPNVNLSLVYGAGDPSVLLVVQTTNAFAGFPFGNSNEAAVGNNLDALNAAGALATNPDLLNSVQVLVGQSDSVINNALDQLHPAIYSAFNELQVDTGAQIISHFFRPSYFTCRCNGSGTAWIEPFGNWYDEKSLEDQIGFSSRSFGLATGVDKEIFDGWIVGGGAAFQHSDLSWHQGRGHGDTNGYYAAVYTDWDAEDFYIGASLLCGVDTRSVLRHIQYVSIDRQAVASSSGLDVIAQIAGAYFFGVPTFLLYPYASFDFFYYQNGSFNEEGAEGLNLDVQSWTYKTIRTEGGLAFQLLEINPRETICLSPTVALGWAMENPVSRDPFVATFAGEPISFKTRGWDHTWQLWTAKLGFRVNYYCFSLYADYRAEISIEKDDFFAQKCDIRFNYSW